MISKKFEKIILIGSIVAMVLGYNFYKFFWDGFFYHCMAIGVFLSFTLIKSLTHNRKDLSGIANVCFWLSVSNLVDEFFFNPTAIGINEYIFAVIIIVWQWKFQKR